MARIFLLLLLLVPGLPLSGFERGQGDLRADLSAVEQTIREGLKALKLAGKDIHPRHDFIAPDAWRLGLITAWLERPAAVSRRAHEAFSPWIEEEESLTDSLVRAFRVLGHREIRAPARSRAGSDLFRSVRAFYTDASGRTVEGALKRATFRKEAAVIPGVARAPISEILSAVHAAVRLREQAFAKLTEDEWVELRKFGSQFNTGMPPATQVQFLRRYHDRIDRARLRAAALKVAAALEAVRDLREKLRTVRKRPEFHLVYETPAGRIEFGGFGDNTYRKDALFTLDFGGDDTYVADVFGQGCAYWYAVGVLLDGAGEDTYTVHNYGQGAGFHMAVGVLMDHAGDDRYTGTYHALGHALDRSVGWFVDFAGNDLYESGSESQGAAVKPFAVREYRAVANE